MKRISTILVGLLVLGLAGQSCQQAAVNEPDMTSAGTFDVIQRQILTPSCATAGCHASDKDAGFNQHGLVLAAGVAYDNLMNVAPKNSAAKQDGLLRVKPFASIQSLLYHKLNTGNVHHTGKSYGSLMPLGSAPLTNGQVEFIRRWIEAGAPKTGNVVDPAVMTADNTTPNTPYEALKAPAASEGLQIAMPAFDIAPNFEREIFLYKPVGNAQDMYVNRFAVSMRTNSHHFVAYAMRNVNPTPPAGQVRDLRNSDNSINLVTALYMSNHVYMLGSPNANFEYKFPEGAALLIPAGTSWDFNSHYVNKTGKPFQGEVHLNLYSMPKSAVKQIVKTLDLGNTSITLPPGQRTTLTRSFTFSQARKILTLTSHNHKLGEKFVIKINGGSRNGEVIYTSTDWEHPEMINYATPIVLKANEGLTSEITYNNTTTKTVNFGLTSDDEMGIIFGYYVEE
jgi:hypothetical protein